MTMTERPERQKGYVPPLPLEGSPLLDWPPRPLKLARYAVRPVLVPWGMFWIGLTALLWNAFTPSMARMENLAIGWAAEIWLRNLVLTAVFVGAQHYFLYVRRTQGLDYKLNARWMSRSRTFLFGRQSYDNAFWSLASGVAIWTAYEVLFLWAYANGWLLEASWSDHWWYLAPLMLFAFFWSTIHFYFNHRLLHWAPLYRSAHYLHHKNANTGPWTGISMHPIEHVIYFSVPILVLMIPAHPTVAMLVLLYNGLSPSTSHSNFARWKLPFGAEVPAGDHFHNLHHRYFECNYGNLSSPIDRLFGTFHDGTPEAHEVMRDRMRARRMAAGNADSPGV